MPTTCCFNSYFVCVFVSLQYCHYSAKLCCLLQALFDQVVLHRDSIVMVELWIGKRVRELLTEQDNEADKEENKPSSEEQDQLDDYEKDLEEEADSDSPEKVRRRGVRIVYEEQKLVGWSAFRLVKLTEMESEEG